jgi:type I restriction enzyme, S subunit
MVVPPKKEQISIVTLDGEATKLDNFKAEIQRGIELLNGRRTPLISVVVSGKIDVRNFDASTF